MALDKTFDANSAETRIYEAWEKIGAFRAGANAKDGHNQDVYEACVG